MLVSLGTVISSPSTALIPDVILRSAKDSFEELQNLEKKSKLLLENDRSVSLGIDTIKAVLITSRFENMTKFCNLIFNRFFHVEALQLMFKLYV